MPEQVESHLEARVNLEARVLELEGDLRRLVNLLGGHLGGVFAEQAAEIVNRQQGK